MTQQPNRHTNKTIIIKIEKGTRVKVISGDQRFDGVVGEVEWDIDQGGYLINGEYYCQSEVTVLLCD